MSRTYGVTRTRFPGGERRRPRRDDDVAARERIMSRLDHNWRVKTIDTGQVLALEPGREHEQVFEGGPDPFWEAVTFAAACLRGDTDPAS